MLTGYHRTFNAHALRDLLRTVDVPDPQLGVGWAETLSTQAIHVSYQAPAQQVKRESVRTLEDSSVKWQGSQVSLDQFPSSGWMGDPYGGGY